MPALNKNKTSPEVKHAYNQFMLNFEIQALRITCAFGAIHVVFFLILDYWRAQNYTYVVIYRSGSILVILSILLLTYRPLRTNRYFNFLCLALSSVLPILFYLLDITAGMPEFFLPNSICLFFYVFNACLGHSFRAKVIHTFFLTASYLLYAVTVSPHLRLHSSQVWNVLLNASISLLIGYLVVWFKRLSFLQQEQLLETNSKLDLALRSVEMGAWSWDLKTNKRTFDRQSCLLLGLNYETFDGSPETFFSVIHPEDIEGIKRLMKETLENKKNGISPEYRVIWPDGSIHFVKSRGKVFYDDQGHPIRINGIGWDITEQKNIEEELKVHQDALIESEGRFRQISETINDVFYLYNIEEKKYEFISKNCTKVLGAPPDFFYRGEKYTQTFVIDEDKEKALGAIALVDSGTPYEVDYRIINKGEVKWIREKSFPIKDRSGKAIKNSGICTDITHLKLQEIQLMAQKRHLETLNATKDKFFSIVAHDLKSPLNSLRAFTRLLIDHTDKFSKEEIINTSKQADEALENTVKMADNLITWARLQMNDYELNQKKIYFNEIVYTILPIYRRVAEKKGISLTWAYDESLSIFCDKNQIEFIIRNLLNNAVKFTPKDGTVKLEAISLEHKQVQISVTDTGVGIPEEKKHAIFTVGKAKSTKGTAGEKGTGLGLMLCYEFTKLNGGEIDVESEEGKGTTFRVRLKDGSE